MRRLGQIVFRGLLGLSEHSAYTGSYLASVRTTKIFNKHLCFKRPEVCLYVVCGHPVVED